MFRGPCVPPGRVVDAQYLAREISVAGATCDDVEIRSLRGRPVSRNPAPGPAVADSRPLTLFAYSPRAQQRQPALVGVVREFDKRHMTGSLAGSSAASFTRWVFTLPRRRPAWSEARPDHGGSSPGIGSCDVRTPRSPTQVRELPTSHDRLRNGPRSFRTFGLGPGSGYDGTTPVRPPPPPSSPNPVCFHSLLARPALAVIDAASSAPGPRRSTRHRHLPKAVILSLPAATPGGAAQFAVPRGEVVHETTRNGP